jgi:hypothetical protein
VLWSMTVRAATGVGKNAAGSVTTEFYALETGERC